MARGGERGGRHVIVYNVYERDEVACDVQLKSHF